MYVRWQKSPPRRCYYGSVHFGRPGDVRWSAVLVECVRVNGKPVQKHIASLIAFSEQQIGIEPQRCHIWNDIEERLDKLANRLSPKDRKRVEAAIAKKLPRPSRRDQIRVARQHLKFFGDAKWLTRKQRELLATDRDAKD